MPKYIGGVGQRTHRHEEGMGLEAVEPDTRADQIHHILGLEWPARSLPYHRASPALFTG